MDETAPAPWFFRRRFTMFGLVYGCAFFFGFFLAGLLRVPPGPAFVSSGRPWLFGALAIACGVGGYALRVWASSHLAGSVVWRDDVYAGDLRASGPYRWTRNPLYLGNFLQAIGIGLLAPWTIIVLLLPSMLAFQLALIAVEERHLARELGAAYERYRASVARFVPLPWKVAPDDGRRGSLRDGVRSETMTAVFAAATVAMVLLSWPR